jgi:DNA-directed RNA polymerase specialized sigma24 family protein
MTNFADDVDENSIRREDKPMETHWFFSGCDTEHETLVARCWDERLLELEGKLNALPAEPSELHVAVHYDDDRPRWEVQMALHLPGTTLATDSAGDRVEEVFDRVLGALARQIDEQDEQPSAAELPAASASLVGLLRRNHSQGRSDAFCGLLEPALRRLTGYLENALGTLESEDGLPSEEVTVDDVLNEAMAHAWDRFGQYDRHGSDSQHPPPEGQPLDQWLRELVDDVLRQSNRPLAQRSLDEEVGEPADDVEDPLRDAWTESGGYQQTIELADMLTGHPGVDSWDRLSDAAKKSRVAESLDALPRDQRQALVLSLTEGYSVAQIADFQGRSAREVQQDIDTAQQALRRDVDADVIEALESRLSAARRRTRGRR